MNAAVETVIALTDRVEAAIEAGDWPQAQQLEAERRQLLEQLALAHDAQTLRETYTALETRNYRLIGLVEHQKRRVLREAAVARAARDGAAAYSELGRAAEPSVA
jgi:uncharacterized protein YeaC (DUF1315 family)